jgi:pectate lyase
MWYVGSNTSIIGLTEEATIKGGGFHIYSGSGAQANAQEDGKHNIVIRNLTFTEAAEDALTVEGGSHHVWIDHNDFVNAADGLVDIKRGSDYVTVSWNYFQDFDHGKVSLVGHDDDVGDIDEGYLNVTYHHNWFAGTYSRHPRVRFGDVHVYNNYYDGTEDEIDYGI